LSIRVTDFNYLQYPGINSGL